jgi:ElaB/YqjD/DUF883 family membrane-anchored ribosome-binding protein
MDTPASSPITDALHHVIAETEAILQSLADDQDPKLSALRERVQGTVDAARARLEQIESAPERPLERAATATEHWVRENPWTTVALCLGAGVLVGMLVGRTLRRAARAASAEP